MKYKLKRLYQSAITVIALQGFASGQLIHQWTFDETEGDALDSVGANPGVLNNALRETDDVRGPHLVFNGTDSSVNPSLLLPAMTLENDFTWATWANAQALPSNGPQRNAIILGNRRDGANADFVPREFIKLSPIQFEYRPQDDSENTTNLDLPLDVWVHLAVVKDGDTFQTYFNGIPQSMTTLPATEDDNEFVNLMPFFIGGELGQNGNEHFAGRIDDVQLFESALTPEEVLALIGDTPLFPFFTTNPISPPGGLFGTPISGSVGDLVNSFNGEEPTFALVSGPEWLTVNADGTYSGTPAESDIGDNEFVVSVTDSVGTSEATLQIAVAAASSPLLAGWDNWEEVEEGVYDATVTGLVTAQVVGALTQGNGQIGPLNNSGLRFGASLDGSWGSVVGQSGVAAADTTADNGTAAVSLPTRADGTFDFTITASEGESISFTGFGFDAFRRFGSSSDMWELSVLSGDITNGPIEGATGNVTQAATGGNTLDQTLPNDFDVDLTVIPDRTLEAGESAVFRLEFSGANPGTSGGNITSIDNVGFFGDIAQGDDLQLAVTSDGDNLTFTWNSQGGQVYSLLSETDLETAPATWPIFDGNMDIVATPPTNTLTLPRPDDATRFFVIEETPSIPTALLSENFENGDGGFIASVAEGTVWEIGSPNSSGLGGEVIGGAPGSVAGAWGTNLGLNDGGSGAVTVTGDNPITLRSPDIDLTASSTATVSFFEALDLATGDTAVLNLIDASDDSVLAELYTAVDVNATGAPWEQAQVAGNSEFSLAAGLGSTVYLRWEFIGTDPSDFLGWYIDDVVVTGN